MGDDDGAYGEFTFSAAQQTITLEYNERYTETHYQGTTQHSRCEPQSKLTA
jgi:hypothetical protein